MDDIQVGSVFRTVRLRQGLSQAEVAASAGLSRSTVSLLEHGHLRGASVGAVRDVAAALEISLPFAPRWRGPELAKLLDEAHSRVVGATLTAIKARGWHGRPELTFSRWGERGSIDIFAWREDVRAVIDLECKSVVADTQDTIATMDRKRRLTPDIAAEVLGWKPRAIASVLVLPETTCSRNRVRHNAAVLDAALPARTLEIRRWMEEPTGDLAGIWFLRCSVGSGAREGSGQQLRVHEPKTRR